MQIENGINSCKYKMLIKVFFLVGSCQLCDKIWNNGLKRIVAFSGNLQGWYQVEIKIVLRIFAVSQNATKT